MNSLLVMFFDADIHLFINDIVRVETVDKAVDVCNRRLHRFMWDFKYVGNQFLQKTLINLNLKKLKMEPLENSCNIKDKLHHSK